MKKTNQNFTRSQQINFGNKLISKVAIWRSDCWLLLTLNEVVNELADRGSGLKCLRNSRGDLAGRRRIDKSRRSPLHIPAGSWAGSQRWCGSALLSVWCVSGSGWKSGKQLGLWFMQRQTFQIDLKLAVRGWRHGEESKYRIIWSHMSGKCQNEPRLSSNGN